jgi:hypothetical protein
MGRPAKVTPQIKQALIELTLQHSNFADLQNCRNHLSAIRNSYRMRDN